MRTEVKVSMKILHQPTAKRSLFLFDRCHMGRKIRGERMKNCISAAKYHVYENEDVFTP